MGFPLAVVRAGFRLLSVVAPATAERLAARLFLTPRRTSREPPRVPGLQPRRLELSVRGRRVVAYQWGEGPPVVLAHGWAGRPYHLAAFVRPLLSAGYSVLAPDMPAHGASAGSSTTLFEFARTIQELARTAGPLHGIVAHSLGATGAAIALRDGLSVNRVVMIAPANDAMQYVGQFLEQVGLSSKHHDGTMRRVSERAGEDLNGFTTAAVLRRCLVPGLVLHDRADVEVPCTEGERIAATWPGARFVQLAGAGHFDILKHPDAVRLGVEFLTGEGGANGSASRAPSGAGARDGQHPANAGSDTGR